MPFKLWRKQHQCSSSPWSGNRHLDSPAAIHSITVLYTEQAKKTAIFPTWWSCHSFGGTKENCSGNSVTRITSCLAPPHGGRLALTTLSKHSLRRVHKLLLSALLGQGMLPAAEYPGDSLPLQVSGACFPLLALTCLLSDPRKETNTGLTCNEPLMMGQCHWEENRTWFRKKWAWVLGP